MPKWIEDCVRIIFRFPLAQDNKEWRRFRIACTREEMEEYKKWYAGQQFVRTLRGIPLVIEEDPHNPDYIMEE